jgi:zinc protease
MKHLLRGLFIAVLFICCNFQLVLAQPMQELPVDKNVRAYLLHSPQRPSRKTS